MIILSQNWLHQSIPSGRFTPFSNKSGYSTDLRFSSVVGVFTLFCPFSWISDIWTWKSRSCDIIENFQTPIQNQWNKLYPIPRSNLWSARRCPLRGHPSYLAIWDKELILILWTFLTDIRFFRKHFATVCSLFNSPDLRHYCVTSYLNPMMTSLSKTSFPRDQHVTNVTEVTKVDSTGSVFHNKHL